MRNLPKTIENFSYKHLFLCLRSVMRSETRAIYWCEYIVAPISREYSGEFGFTQLAEFDVNFSVSVSAGEQKSNWQGTQSHVWTQTTTQQGGADIDAATCGMLCLRKGGAKRTIYKHSGE